MSRNDCEAVLHLHRMFRPRRRTGRGFLTGTVFLDAALLISAFVLATSPFVRKPGILLDLPVSTQAGGIRFNDMVLSISREGLIFFDDELVSLDRLQPALRAAAQAQPGVALILEADQSIQQSTVTAVYDAAAAAGFRQVFIATQNAAQPAP
ncbi:MAG: biopolymer transporter ExbD [Kiritimatiellales bacterium]|nr:biopolymer transporter ExbD [Kiritimatiellota bacterium]MBL7012242.1 biopolymer transporter ExbD [Kiritimatiellales bacterium]